MARYDKDPSSNDTFCVGMAVTVPQYDFMEIDRHLAVVELQLV